MYQREEINLHCLNRSRPALNKLIDEFQVKYNKGERLVYSFVENHWEYDGTFRERGFESVALSDVIRDKIIREMAGTGKEPIGSMGNDVPVAVLSKKPYRLFVCMKP